ncbi:hypothetical protein EMCRGX_G011162 [Ephydatia muelleri]
MAQERLQGLALLCIESELAKTIDYDSIIATFASRKDRKAALWEETLVLDVHIYGIPHHLVMLPPMMNMEFYDIDIVMAMQLPHYRLHKTFVLTYKSTQTRSIMHKQQCYLLRRVSQDNQRKYNQVIKISLRL